MSGRFIIKELFISDYDAAREQQLTKTGSINLSPAFSPDGEAVYYTSYVEGDPNLFRVDIASGQSTRVANFPGTIIYKQPHRMEVDQTPAGYNRWEDAGFNLRRYFHPAVHHSLFFSERITVQSVMRTQPDFVLSTMHAANSNPLAFGWNAHEYELLTSSTNASYQ